MKTSLVIGASGQVGAQLLGLCTESGAALGTYCRHPQPGLLPLDLRDHAAVADLLGEIRPTICYLPAAFTHVDEAERQPLDCRAVNLEAVEHIAWILSRCGGRLVFFSTEHVFGDAPQPRSEEDPVNPLSRYARSKARAEETIRELLPAGHLIVRTSWVFGPDPQEKNFYYRVRNTLSRGRKLIVASDQYGQPTYAPDLAAAAVRLAERGTNGTIHVVGPQSFSRLAWAQAIARRLRLPARLIEGRPTVALDQQAPRPLHVRLARSKLERLLGAASIRPPLDGIRELQQEVGCTAA